MTRPFTALVLTLLVSGCLYQDHQTHSARSATEQLLLTESIERAVAGLVLPEVGSRAVAVETVSLAGDDAHYLRSVVARRLRESGARVVPPDLAEVIFVAQIGTLGTTRDDVTFGVPAVPLPGGAHTPSLPIVRWLRQRGHTKLRLVAHDSAGGLIDAGSESMEHARHDLYGFLFLVVRSQDVYPD